MEIAIVGIGGVEGKIFNGCEYTGPHIVRKAGKHGLSVPTHERIYAALKKQLHEQQN